MKYVSIDLETTGLDPREDQILQVGAVVEDTEQVVPVDDLPSFNVIVRHERIHGHPFALNMNARLLVVEPTGCTPTDTYERFRTFLETNLGTRNKWVAAGKNFGSFDRQFLHQAFPNLTGRFHHRYLDPTFAYIQRDDFYPPDTLLCGMRAGLNKQVEHDALSDAKYVVELLRRRWPK